MKYFLLIISICLLSCQNRDEKRALSEVKEYLKTHLHDYNSFEIVESKLDSSFNSPFYTYYEEKAEEQRIKDSIDAVKAPKIDPYAKKITDTLVMTAPSNHTPPVVEVKQSDAPVKLKEFTGWHFFIKFRSKNMFGANVLQYYGFKLSPDFSILEVKDMDAPFLR